MDKKENNSTILIIVTIVLLAAIFIIFYFMAPKETLSNNANLDSLVIESYPINFESGNLNYTIEVDDDVDSLEVKASPEDTTSKVTITGNTNLQTGNNEITITVTSTDNSTKVYRVIVIKKDSVIDNVRDEIEEIPGQIKDKVEDIIDSATKEPSNE